VKINKEKRMKGCVPRDWEAVSNYEYSELGRIWICWNPKGWTCYVCSKSMQQISLIATNKGGFQMLLTAIYGSTWQSKRVELWKDMIQVKNQYGSFPWMVAGDFNVVRYTEERVGGRKLTYNQLKEFNECLDACILTDIRSH